jgi:hypothetical protein
VLNRYIQLRIEGSWIRAYKIAREAAANMMVTETIIKTVPSAKLRRNFFQSLRILGG